MAAGVGHIYNLKKAPLERCDLKKTRGSRESMGPEELSLHISEWELFEITLTFYFLLIEYWSLENNNLKEEPLK